MYNFKDVTKQKYHNWALYYIINEGRVTSEGIGTS